MVISKYLTPSATSSLSAFCYSPSIYIFKTSSGTISFPHPQSDSNQKNKSIGLVWSCQSELVMPLSERIRSALAMTIWHPSNSSGSLSDADENVVNSPNSSPVTSRGRTPTSESSSSTASIITIPAHRLKNKFSDLRGKQRRKQLRYNEALVQWAQADEREWLYPTWGGPAKKSRKYSREQRDSLRSWGWDQSLSNSSFECRSPRSSMCSEISPCTSRNNLFFPSQTPPPEPMFSTAGRKKSTFQMSSRDERLCTMYGKIESCLYI